jgi:hypothetical protein
MFVGEGWKIPWKDALAYLPEISMSSAGTDLTKTFFFTFMSIDAIC